MLVRPIAPDDVPALFEVRVSTDQNHLSREQLTDLGITERSVLQRLDSTYRGWLCEALGNVVGFAMGDAATGELWVIAVRPEHVCRGIGSILIRQVEEWLWSERCPELWLTTHIDPKLRAYRFYLKHGWEDWKVEGDVRYMRKRPAPRPL